MERDDDKTGKVTALSQEVAAQNMLLTEAIFELLAEKGILNGEEVIERVKKIKAEMTLGGPVSTETYARIRGKRGLPIQ